MTANLTTFEDLANRFAAFAEDSIRWCVLESERATSAVMQAIDVLFQKTDRISKLSTASLDALQDVKDRLAQHQRQKFSPQDIAHLTRNLAELAKDHSELSTITSAMIEALQFQDRLRHRLENIVKMTQVWLVARQEAVPRAASSRFLAGVGERLAQQTTSADERAVLRAHFQGMSEEINVTQAVNLF